MNLIIASISAYAEEGKFIESDVEGAIAAVTEAFEQSMWFLGLHVHTEFDLCWQMDTRRGDSRTNQTLQ